LIGFKPGRPHRDRVARGIFVLGCGSDRQAVPQGPATRRLRESPSAFRFAIGPPSPGGRWIRTIGPPWKRNQLVETVFISTFPGGGSEGAPSAVGRSSTAPIWAGDLRRDHNLRDDKTRSRDVRIPAFAALDPRRPSTRAASIARVGAHPRPSPGFRVGVGDPFPVARLAIRGSPRTVDEAVNTLSARAPAHIRGAEIHAAGGGKPAYAGPFSKARGLSAIELREFSSTGDCRTGWRSSIPVHSRPAGAQCRRASVRQITNALLRRLPRVWRGARRPRLDAVDRDRLADRCCGLTPRPLMSDVAAAPTAHHCGSKTVALSAIRFAANYSSGSGAITLAGRTRSAPACRSGSS